MRRVRPTVLLAVAVAACAPGENSNQSSAAGSTDSTRPASGAAAATPATTANDGAPTRIAVTQGLQTPESVRYDPDLDVYFISNINGSPGKKDNNGWIGRVRADSIGARATVFVAGGQDGVFLHAPKGMAIQGDTLWVTDIDIVRGFDKRTGKFVAAVGFWSKNVTFLNDIVLGGDGALYITDTGISFDADGQMTHSGVDRVFRLAGRAMTEEVKGDVLAEPNGIAYDSANTRFLLAPFGGRDVQTWRPGALPEHFATGPGSYDGIEIVNGRVYVTSWADSAVHVVDNGTLRPIIRNVAAPADIGADTKRRILAVPRFSDGRVEYYKLP